MSWTLEEIAEICRGTCLGQAKGLVVSHLCSDTRQIRAGDLFLALSGPRFDGHEFLDEAVRGGAVAAIICESAKGKLPPNLPAVAVTDTRCALGQLGSARRSLHSMPVVAVAGSNGKTTTKEILAALLRQAGPVLANHASFNNDIGVPLTLLEMEPDHRAAILEVGTNHPGELAPLLDLIRPQYGMITQIGREHLEFFQHVQGVAEEEGVLAEKLPPRGTLFLYGDAPFADRIAARAQARVVRVGAGPENDWRVGGIEVLPRGTRFQVQAPDPGFSGRYEIALLGRHQAMNAALAMAAAACLGLSRNAIESGLGNCKPVRMRMEPVEAGGVYWINDAYNANTDSMVAALQTLREMPCEGRRIAVLGDMAELGEASVEAHREVGRSVALLGCDGLYTIGSASRETARSARDHGMIQVHDFDSVELAADVLREEIRPGDLVLLKASRAARLERILQREDTPVMPARGVHA